MRRETSNGSISRRLVLGSSGLLPLAMSVDRADAALPPAPYKVSINIEIMFPRTMSRDKRMEAVAAQGFRAYSFWRTTDQEQAAMLEAQKRLGLKCVSVVGSGPSGRTTGLTKPGAEQPWLDEVTAGIKIAEKFGGADAIIFTGQLQPDVPWETQRQGIVNGLRKAGDIAKQHGVCLTLEPLSRYETPRQAIVMASEAFPIIAELAHPNVKVCFDLYHLQLSEGNLTNNLKLGWEKGWIRIVQVGDVPGRKEPGTGETNYPHIFRILREIGYNGYLDTEYGTTSTPEHAMEVVKRLSTEN
jgi:hydroxypyruvate isomerase